MWTPTRSITQTRYGFTYDLQTNTDAIGIGSSCMSTHGEIKYPAGAWRQAAEVRPCAARQRLTEPALWHRHVGSSSFAR